MRPLKIILFITLFSLTALAAAFVVDTDFALAQIGVRPFGGRVLFTIPCTCSFGTLVTVGPPRGGTFIQAPVTRVYNYGRVLPPSWVLGIASGYGVCLEATPAGCVEVGSGPIMIKVGTSMY